MSLTASSSSPSPESHRASAPERFYLGAEECPTTFKNIGSTPGRMIITVTPAGLEGFFAEIATLLGSREDAPIPPTPEDIEKLLQTAPKYGVEILPNH